MLQSLESLLKVDNFHAAKTQLQSAIYINQYQNNCLIKEENNPVHTFYIHISFLRYSFM